MVGGQGQSFMVLVPPSLRTFLCTFIHGVIFLFLLAALVGSIWQLNKPLAIMVLTDKIKARCRRVLTEKVILAIE